MEKPSYNLINPLWMFIDPSINNVFVFSIFKISISVYSISNNLKMFYI